MEAVVRERNVTLQEELKRMLSVIKEKYHPEKIILFGSLASGKVQEWSDIDLVIIKKTNKRFIDRLHEIRSLADPNVGVNFIVYTPEEAQMMIDKEHYFFVDEIIGKGKVLYERAE